MLPAVRLLFPVSVSVLYVLYKYLRSGRVTELSEDIAVPLNPDNDDVVSRQPSHVDPAILEEIRKFDPAVLDELRKFLDEFRKFDPAALDEKQKFDPAALDVIRKLDPAIIDLIHKLCVKEKVEGKEEAERNCSGRENEKGNETQSEESGGGGGENKNENGGEVEKKVVSEERSRRHHYPVRPEAGDCSFYLKTGTCKFGSNCKFNHPRRRKTNKVSKDKMKEREGLAAEKPGQTESKGEKDCSFYMRNGSCMFGTNCRFNHPDPTAARESDPPSGYGNGGPASLQGALSSTAAPCSAPRSLNDAPLYVPMVIPPSQGIPSQNTEWNGYQAPAYLQERSMPARQPYLVNNSVTGTNVYKQYLQHQQAEEFPERPGQPVCSYFLRTGDCKFKSDCKYHHPKTQTAVFPSCTL
ncbi:zinc finger CCCH domain-containing protein 43-like isoform X2 [Prunus dulcis]|uniref:zinc finger CCCH domain-containing protein 43-like isoform X2 n=1 Tax=Prunus dulcis TaxID=3755 RepID=UPI001482FA8B|nr:zinc finger CCCH domain-containing protein 43-like isoform X2 [Prunus dulcis]